MKQKKAIVKEVPPSTEISAKVQADENNKVIGNDRATQITNSEFSEQDSNVEDDCVQIVTVENKQMEDTGFTYKMSCLEESKQDS